VNVCSIACGQKPGAGLSLWLTPVYLMESKALTKSRRSVVFSGTWTPAAWRIRLPVQIHPHAQAARGLASPNMHRCNQEDEPLLCEDLRIKLLRNWPLNGYESLRVGEPKPSGSVHFYSPGAIASTVNRWRKAGTTDVKYRTEPVRLQKKIWWQSRDALHKDLILRWAIYIHILGVDESRPRIRLHSSGFRSGRDLTRQRVLISWRERGNRSPVMLALCFV
jgi:hypothetical protein